MVRKPPTNHIAQVFQTPEVARVFVSSFWDEAYRFQDRRAPGGTSVLHRDTLGVIGSSNTWIVGVEKNILPSGNLTGCYWKWPFIAALAIKNVDFL